MAKSAHEKRCTDKRSLRVQAAGSSQKAQVKKLTGSRGRGQEEADAEVRMSLFAAWPATRGRVYSEFRFFRVCNDLRDAWKELSGRVFACEKPPALMLFPLPAAIWLNCVSVGRRLRVESRIRAPI